jgi:hypothetical protein
MKMRLYAAIVTEKSDLAETKSLNGLGKAVKQIERLEAMVADAWKTITEQRHAHPSLYYQAVFLAPEYFFSNQRHMQHRFFSHEVKRLITFRLHALAKQYPHLLIVPGTVLWTKELYDTNLQKMPGSDQWQQVKVDNDNRRQKALARIGAAGTTFRTAISKPGWSHTKDVETSDRKLAQNVAYICLGDKILKYHKVGNFQEVMGEVDDLVFVPGSIVGRFQVGGVKYGIEVCMDHALGAFHSSVDTKGKVHIQIIVSSYVTAKTNTDASVTLHASTEEAHTFDKTTTITTPTGDKVRVKATKTTPKGTQMPLKTTTGTNPIRFGGDKVAKLARAPIKKDSYTLWVIDVDAPDLQNPSIHTLSSPDLNEVAHIH